MAKTSRIAARWAVIEALKKCKWNVTRAALSSKKSKQFVLRWKQHFLKTKNIYDRTRTGRPGKISASTRSAAVALVAEEQSVPAATAILKEQKLLEPEVHVKTLWRAVSKDMDCKTVQLRPILSAASRANRCRFAQQQHDADRLIAIDSTYFTLGQIQTRRKYWVVKGTRAVAGRPNKSQQLHVYGGITAHGQTNLVFVTGTTGHSKVYHNSKGQLSGVGAVEFREIMENNLVPDAQQIFAAAHVNNYSWLIDNAPAHAAKATKQYFSSNNINYCQTWPANSPDLNPIENVWAWMKQKVYAKHYNSLAELKQAVRDAWTALPISMCKSLMHSLQQRKAICLERDGGYTGY